MNLVAVRGHPGSQRDLSYFSVPGKYGAPCIAVSGR
jgi:hypothetical protein